MIGSFLPHPAWYGSGGTVTSNAEIYKLGLRFETERGSDEVRRLTRRRHIMS